jgi:hypothetical protein
MNIYNPNEFPIEAGFFSSTAKLNNQYSPYTLEFKQSGNDKMIAPRSTKKLYLTWQTNFVPGNIMQAFGSGTLLPNNPALQGSFGVDIGYGLMEIPYNFTLPFKFGN